MIYLKCLTSTNNISNKPNAIKLNLILCRVLPEQNKIQEEEVKFLFMVRNHKNHHSMRNWGCLFKEELA